MIDNSTLILKQYQALATEIARLANIYFNTTLYSLESIELLSVLRDLHDGRGYRINSIAGLRNPNTQHYDVRVDIIGSSSEVLKELHEKFQKMTNEKLLDITYDLRFKVSQIKSN